MTGVVGSSLRQVIIAMVALVLSCTALFAQKSQGTPGRQSSIDEFASGNYEQAYSDFSQLLAKYPKDPLYKYYSGACLVMLKKDPAKALQLLDQSVNGASVVKSLPPESLFYLARAQQLNGKFTEAIASFNSYTDEVGRKSSREMGVPAFLQECEDRKGMIAASEVKQETRIQETVTPPAVIERNDELIAGAMGNAAVNTEPASPVGERRELPAESENLLDDALKLQYRADSLGQVISDQKRLLETLPEQEKGAMRMKISQNEMQAAAYQRSADSKYSVAQVKMNQQPVPDAGMAVTVTEQKKPDTELPSQPAVNVNPPPVTGKAVTTTAEVTSAAGAVSLFAVLPKDAVYPDEKIKIDPELPSGLLYRIQLAVFRNPVAPAFFKGITPVYGLRIAGTDKTSYYAGMFRKSADAKKVLPQVREAGFKDAFVVSVADGKPISAERAALMEKEWGNKPLFGDQAAGRDTIPPTLTFRVEVARAPKPLKPEQVEALKTMAGSKGLDVLHLADGGVVYLIGKFITFESAEEYADLLVRNNYRTAKVVAWLGSKEVPIETAKQLFNGL